MALGSRTENLLNGEEIIKLWVEMKSLGRVSRLFREQGRVNERTGQPFSEAGLWRAVMIFLVEKPDEGRKYYAQAGETFTDMDWEVFVLKKAMLVYKTNRSTFLRWVIVKEWPRKYEHHYRELFNVKPEDYDYFAQSSRKMPRRGMRGYYQGAGSESVPE